MAEKLFGTDGYRGEADNSQETGINPATFKQLAYEFIDLVSEKTDQPPVVVVGSDTRESSPELRKAVCVGAAAAGALVWDVEVAPTPVIAWAAQKHWTYAISITASHNPGSDNGFKPFDLGGIKLNDETLRELETRYFTAKEKTSRQYRKTNRWIARTDLIDEYLEDTTIKLGGKDALNGKIIVVDGAEGAASDLAPKFYMALGAEVVKYACDGDGKNINNGCGAASLDGVKVFLKNNPKLTQSSNFLGVFASDGDGDRVMGVDQRGKIIDGNYWLNRLAIGQLGIVGTIYTNPALRRAVGEKGITFYECANGDHYVTARLLELTKVYGSGYSRGGEFTGHLIDLDHLSNGDGIYMGAWLAIQAAAEDISLADIHDELVLWPERMVNIRVDRAIEKIAEPRIQEIIDKEKAYLGDNGNIVVRPSGTQPLVRVYAVSKHENVEAITSRIANAIQSA